MDEIERKQFTFFVSFYKAACRIRKKTDRCDFYDAVAAYALYGSEPDLDALPDAAAIAFELIKPTLDASKRKANSGKKGGSKTQADAKQNGSKTEANDKQTAREKEKEKENEIEIEKEEEDECLKRARDGAVAAVFAYRDKINATPSERSMTELEGFAREMGVECCLRAIDIALEEKKTTWSYIKAILEDKKARGVRCLADWDELEERRKQHGHGVAGGLDPADAGRDGTVRYGGYTLDGVTVL